MRGWIHDCESNHGICYIPKTFTPIRLLNVRNGIALQHMDIQDTDSVTYVALSHCWGAPGIKKSMLTTDISTIGERMTGIAMER